MELPDCRADFLGISVLNSWEQYAKARSLLPNHVVKKPPQQLYFESLLVVFFLLQTDHRCVHLSRIFLHENIFQLPQKGTIQRKSHDSWSPCQATTSRGYGNIGQVLKSNTKVWEDV